MNVETPHRWSREVPLGLTIADLQKEHVPVEDENGTWCKVDDEGWPCRVSVLLHHVIESERARARRSGVPS